MSTSQPVSDRRAEAERLIDRARAMLDQPEDEMVVNYLDHAIETLHMISQSDVRETA